VLTNEDNQMLTEVGLNIPIGELSSRFWRRGLLSEQLPVPDSTPVRLLSLREHLLAIRDTNGDRQSAD
jgi:phthalate 4,5-dioxygenase